MHTLTIHLSEYNSSSLSASSLFSSTNLPPSSSQLFTLSFPSLFFNPFHLSPSLSLTIVPLLLAHPLVWCKKFATYKKRRSLLSNHTNHTNTHVRVLERRTPPTHALTHTPSRRFQRACKKNDHYQFCCTQIRLVAKNIKHEQKNNRGDSREHNLT